MMKILIILVFLLLGIGGQSSTNAQMSDAVSSVLERRASYEELASSLKRLTNSTASIGLLRTVADDITYPRYHRRLCFLELFERSAYKGMTLSQVSDFMLSTNWLNPEDIHSIKLVTGMVPIFPDGTNSVFAISILPQPGENASGIYLKVEGLVTKIQMVNVLCKRKVNPRSADVRIIDSVVVRFHPKELNE